MPPYLWCGNWNYFAAIRNEKRNPKLEELSTKVLSQHSANLYAANGAGVVFAEKSHFDVSKDIFTQMPDVWINLAHVYFAQGNFALAVKMVWATVAELENASLDAARVHFKADEHEERKIKHKQQVARQMTLAEEVRRKAEEQRKFQLERRMQEDELKRVRQQEEQFARIKGRHSEKRRRKGGKRRKKDKHSTSRYEMEGAEAEMMDDQEEPEDEDANMNYGEPTGQMNEQDDEENVQDPLAAAGLEDSDADEEAAQSTARRRRAFSEPGDDEQPEQQPESSPVRENSAELQSDGEGRKGSTVAVIS
ncbi:hypothetical protein C1H46_009587 [Malus baccata]|uniref:Uncharacterized protein n=1 Tax=Malus baccata TaxID=106549 RepID=A0A540N135_MALBA|nr:hypothetical protein C1H46_009587 [Malus baccata]